MKTKAENEVTLQFPSQSSNERFVRSAVACFAAQMDPTLNELEDIKTAVSEAATNAIVHAYPDSIGKVVVKARICSGNVLELTVRDYGRGIPDIAKAGSPCSPPAAMSAAAWALHHGELHGQPDGALHGGPGHHGGDEKADRPRVKR